MGRSASAPLRQLMLCSTSVLGGQQRSIRRTLDAQQHRDLACPNSQGLVLVNKARLATATKAVAFRSFCPAEVPSPHATRYSSTMTSHSATTTTPRIVDMRLRPPFLHPFFGGSRLARIRHGALGEQARRLARHRPLHPISNPAGSGRRHGEAGIGHGVVVARSTPTVRIANDAIADLVAHANARLIGIASVIPSTSARRRRGGSPPGNPQLGLRALNLDAGFYARPLRADDELLLPLYQAAPPLTCRRSSCLGPRPPTCVSSICSPSTRSQRRFQHCRSYVATASTRTSTR